MTGHVPSDDRQMLADSVRRYVERAYLGAQRKASAAHPHGCLPNVWRDFGDFGWLALCFAESAGGLGGSLADVCVVAEEFGRGAVNEPFVASAVLAGALLADTAMGDVLAGWMPGLMEGGRRIALAPETALRAAAVNGGFLLSGRSAWVPGGAGADAFVLAASVDAGSTAGLFLAESDAPGMLAETCAFYDGQHAARLTLDATAVKHTLWVGASNRLHLVVQPALQRATISHCAQTVGTMQRAYELTLNYAKTRRQFGRTIASNQIVQHRLVDLMVEIEEARALTHAAALAVDCHTQSDGPQAVEAARYTAAAKACVAHAARHVWQETVQLHGAIGMTEEYEVGQFVKRLAAATTLYGSEESHLERLAAISLGALPPSH